MATTFTFGKIEEFNSDMESFAAYKERVRLFLDANDIPAARRVSVFLSIIGTRNYSLLRDLMSPEAPKDKSVDELLTVLAKHLEPEKVIIAERFKFYKRSQGSTESVASFVADRRAPVILVRI